MRAIVKIILEGTALGLLLGMTVVSAQADSDGYYCSGDDYLAYEFRFTDGGTTHRLYLVRFSAEEGMAGPVELSLPEFQVHGMRCAEDSVEVLGWDSVYRVDLRDRTRPRLAGEEKVADRSAVAVEFRSGFGNLGFWNAAVTKSGGNEHTETIDLGARGGGRYQIRIDVRPAGRKCEIHVSSSLVRLAGDGTVAQTVRLVEGPWDTECPEGF